MLYVCYIFYVYFRQECRQLPWHRSVHRHLHRQRLAHCGFTTAAATPSRTWRSTGRRRRPGLRVPHKKHTSVEVQQSSASVVTYTPLPSHIPSMTQADCDRANRQFKPHTALLQVYRKLNEVLWKQWQTNEKFHSIGLHHRICAVGSISTHPSHSLYRMLRPSPNHRAWRFSWSQPWRGGSET